MHVGSAAAGTRRDVRLTSQCLSVCRLPEGGPLGKTWSPPCFVKCTGVEFGLVCGVEQVRG